MIKASEFMCDTRTSEELNVQSMIHDLQRNLVTKEDNVIKHAFTQRGINLDDINELSNIMRVWHAGDPYEHYFYLLPNGEKQRIISIEREPDIQYQHDSFGSFSIVSTKKYY